MWGRTDGKGHTLHGTKDRHGERDSKEKRRPEAEKWQRRGTKRCRERKTGHRDPKAQRARRETSPERPAKLCRREGAQEGQRDRRPGWRTPLPVAPAWRQALRAGHPGRSLGCPVFRGAAVAMWRDTPSK